MTPELRQAILDARTLLSDPSKWKKYDPGAYDKNGKVVAFQSPRAAQW